MSDGLYCLDMRTRKEEEAVKKKRKKKSIKVNWCNPALLLKSKEHHRGNLGLTLFLFDVFRAVFLFYYYCCFPLSLFYFFLLVRSFSAVKYIYIYFKENLNTSETLRMKHLGEMGSAMRLVS